MKNRLQKEGIQQEFWKNKQMSEMSKVEWEALCDGCGKCCLNKLENDETGEVHYTKIACRLLDNESCKCSQYTIRHQFVPECIVLTPKNISEHAYWLPKTCAYYLVWKGKSYIIGIHSFRERQNLFMKQMFRCRIKLLQNLK